MESLTAAGLSCAVYDKVTPDPTVPQIIAGADLFNAEKCDGIIAFGGGSSIDCAKVVGARAVKGRSIESFAGTLQVEPSALIFGSSLPPLIAVPTTAGTGSEATFGAIVRDAEKEIKYAVLDFCLIPSVALLDPELLYALPAGMTAATGMDALTHAVESYVAPWCDESSAKYSESAVKKIMAFLPRCVENGTDAEARAELLSAAYDAGVAISLAGIGYVHALAHTIGGRFHTPHGIANAMIMPYVLDFYGKDVYPQLARLAVVSGLGDKSEGDAILAERFKARIKEMHVQFKMPTFVKGLSVSDAESVATRALQEAHGELHSPFWAPASYWADAGYPLPKYMTQEECAAIVRSLVQQPASRL